MLTAELDKCGVPLQLLCMKKYLLLLVLGLVCALIGLRAQTESPAGASTTTTTGATTQAESPAASGMTTTTTPTTDQHVVVTPADLKWGDTPPKLPPGAKLAVLEGDPTKPGPFTIRVKAPSGWKVAPHTHPTTEKITVLSGTFNIGSGPTADSSNTKALKAGGFVILPAGMQHFASVKGETIFQVSSEGPFVINYINPQDDPSLGKR